MLLSGAGAIAVDLLVQKLIVPGLSHCWLRPSKVLYLSLAQTSFLLELDCSSRPAYSMWELQGRALSFLNYLEPKVFVKEMEERSERACMHGPFATMSFLGTC